MPEPQVQYEVIQQEHGEAIKRTDPDGKVWWIPTNAENSDYRAYLEWVAEQPQA